MINGTLLTGMAKCVGALLLALAVLWPAAETACTTECEAVVHVMERQVQVIIDDEVFWIEDETVGPLVCSLRPGQHSMRVVRDSRVIQEEEFSLQPGQQGVLTAWDQERMISQDPRPERVSHDFLVYGRGPARDD
jgi:hypothetical protein